MVRYNSDKKQNLIRSLLKNAETMIRAGMSQTTRTCGKRSCTCHSDASRRHGPNTYLTFRSKEGKSSGLYVSPEHLAEATEAKRAWDRFWEAATALAVINREELKERWQAAGKARAKR
jgi:hypothetical protein